MVAVGSGGAATVLATSLKTWLAHPRRSDVRIRIEGADGREVVIDAKRASIDDLQGLVRQVLSD
jgi:hypothetical protein